MLGGFEGSDPGRNVGAKGAIVIVPEPVMLCFVLARESAAEAVTALFKGASPKLCGEGTGFLFGTEMGEVNLYFGGLTGPGDFSWKYGSDAVLAEVALWWWALRFEDREEVEERSVLKLGWNSVSVRE